MPDAILIPAEDASQAEGYTLGQAVERVRQAIRTRKAVYTAPQVGRQGYSITDLIARIRAGLRDDDSADANRFIRDDDIVAWCNEALVDLSDKTHSVHTMADGTTSDVKFLTLPPDYLGMGELRLGGVPVQYVDDDEEWNDWAYSGAQPSRVLCHVVEDHLQFYPEQPLATAYELHYIARAYQFTSKTDTNLTNLPVALQVRVVYYGRAHAYWRLRDYFEGDRYMSLYSAGLGGGESEKPTETDQGRPREVQNYEIVAWLNEAWLQLAFAEEFLRKDISATADANGNIALPADFLKAKNLRLSTAGLDGVHGVEFVNDDVFDYWSFDSVTQAPNHYMARVFGAKIEVFPHPGLTATYFLRYVARPTVIEDMSLRPEVPVVLQQKGIDYARAQALMSAPLDKDDLARADRYMAQFMSGLKRGSVNERVMPGPITLTHAPNDFDLDWGAAHL